jgi:hypothetical protein
LVRVDLGQCFCRQVRKESFVTAALDQVPDLWLEERGRQVEDRVDRLVARARNLDFDANDLTETGERYR